MLDALRGRLRLPLGPRGPAHALLLGCGDDGAGRMPAAAPGPGVAAAPVSEAAFSPQAVTDGRRRWPSFAAWCAEHTGARCTLAVSSHLLHELVAEPGLPLADDRAVLEWARPLLLHYHGDAAAAWPLAAWQAGALRGASALRLPIAPLQQAAVAQRVRLAALRPWWSVALPPALQAGAAGGAGAAPAAWRRGPAELLLVEGPRVTAIALRDGQVEGLEIRALDAATPEALDAWCAERPPLPRAVLGSGLAPGRPRQAEPLGPLDPALPAPRWIGSR